MQGHQTSFLKRLLRFIVVSLLLFSAKPSHADRLLSLDIPKVPERTVSPSEIANYLERYKEHDGALLSYEVSIEHSGSKPRQPKADYKFKLGDWCKKWQYTVIVKTRHLVLNPEITDFTTFSFPYKLKKGYFQIEYPDGETELYSVSDMKKRTTAGVRDYYFTFPRVIPGTIITVAYQDELPPHYTPPLEEKLNLQLPIPIEQIRVTYLYPEWWKVNSKQIQENEGIPLSIVNDTAEHRTTLSYSAKNVPAIPLEPFSPPYKTRAKYLYLMITDIKMKELTLTRAQSWDTLSNMFRKSTLKKAERRYQKMETLVDSIINPADSPLTKVNSILSYIHRNIDYSPEDKDGDIKKILQTKKGTAYDITQLARVMLTYIGFTADYLLIHDAYAGYFDPKYVSFSQVTGPALRVTIENQSSVLFPAFRYYQAPAIPPRYREQDALITSENSDFRFWKLPNDTTSFSKFVDVFTVYIDSVENVRILRKENIEGMAGYSTRWKLEELTQKEKEDSLRARVKYAKSNFNVNSVNLTNDTFFQKPLEIVYDFTIHDVVTQTPTEMTIQTAGLFPFGDNDLLADADQRINDIYIPENVTYERKIRFVIPDGWSLPNVPNSETIETDLGTSSSVWEATPEGIQVHQVVTLKQAKQSKEKYPDLLALMGRNAKTAIPALVLTKSQ